jgi:hypothetical protein
MNDMRIFWAVIGLSFVAAAQMPTEGLRAGNTSGSGKAARVAVHFPGALPERYAVFRPGVREGCSLVREAASLPGAAVVEADPDCRAVFNPLADVAVWQEGERGTVVLKDKAGRRIAELAPADGLAYQSVEPASPILSLVALDDQ